MNVGDGERREDPDLLVVDEQMWTGAPLLIVAVERLQVLDVLPDQPVRPVRERRHAGVVQDDERRPPGEPLQSLAVGVEDARTEALSDFTNGLAPFRAFSGRVGLVNDFTKCLASHSEPEDLAEI